MIDQFEAEKWLHAASTDNLVLMIIDEWPYPQVGTNLGTRSKSRCKIPGIARGMLALTID